MIPQLYGDKARFAIEVYDVLGESDSARRVDVWAADRWLTCDCNTVYVPHFAGMLEGDIGLLLNYSQAQRTGRPYPGLSVMDNHRRLLADAEAGDNRDYLAYRFMAWGPTADNVSATLFREHGTAFIPFSFWREQHHDPAELGRVFVAELPVWELASVLHAAAWTLMWAWADRSKWPRSKSSSEPDHGSK